ncbi:MULTISPECIES: hypothetical protein [Rhodovulum]|uniref:Uncharacterized protein n=2 Tax=Rhodovulum TaxID=34008 RepID=A0A844BDU5_9RHOB|nr:MULTISPECIES: hypothetical protein [Rhodovulum]MRH22674.1 hypothetical protein [Rhodovulum strictum]TCM84805.1 hypothetical protein EV216_110123 [Rhodovulum steppense]
MTDPAPWTEAEMLEAAARAVGKIDARGPLGLIRVTSREIEAMALTLVCLGVVPIPPDAPRPDRSPFSPIQRRD